MSSHELYSTKDINNDDDDDDVPCLSAETFAALQDFYQEQEEREKRLQSALPEDVSFEESWQLSQFWYDEDTIDRLVNIALTSAGPNGKIALISCPSIYNKLKKGALDGQEIALFEFDKRFAIYGPDFNYYDYCSPLLIPRDKSCYYDIVLADPPFLSEECLTKIAVTIRFLAKDKIVLCTGAVMAGLVERLLGLKKTSFIPKHVNNLANEFMCCSNFNINELL